MKTDTANTLPQNQLPLVLCGPLLRRVTNHTVTLWLVTSYPTRVQLRLTPHLGIPIVFDADHLEQHHCQRICLAHHAHVLMLNVMLSSPLPFNTWIGYELSLLHHEQWVSIHTLHPDLCYPGFSTPGFILQKQVNKLLHGSCRKPHFPAQDGLVRGDTELMNTPIQDWPTLLMMSGDQVYVDDVAAPLLTFIHCAIAVLEFKNEPLPGTSVLDSFSLHTHSEYCYKRETLLPIASRVDDTVFRGVRKPIFTSANAQNHLVSLAEMFTMYLLVWSPALWQHLEHEFDTLNADPNWTEANQQCFNRHKIALKQFATTLPQARRFLAHLPTAMMFDDHDITDDWNLTAEWEYDAYGHPFSKRIIGNALIAYTVCQHWGNAPEQIPKHWPKKIDQLLQQHDPQAHSNLIDELLDFRRWAYQWPTTPPLIVLDTRTHRWHAEKLHKPSGLMDFESLQKLHRELQHKNSVLLVSPAPMFGVKLIEAIQKLFSMFDHALVVDAENWMAHKGTAKTMMNIFHHDQTPKQFVILSGDVHYSFVYDVELRQGNSDQEVWQITSSGLINEFPKTLLTWFDRLNRWLYAPHSPLNWFTKRRNLKIIPRKPADAQRAQRLVNQAGIGMVKLDDKGRPIQVVQLGSNGKDIEFIL